MSSDSLLLILPEEESEQGALFFQVPGSAGSILFSAEGLEQDKLLETHPALVKPQVAAEAAGVVKVFDHQVTLGGDSCLSHLFYRRQRHVELRSGFFRIEQHGGTQTVLAFL